MIADYLYKEMLDNMYEGIYFVDKNRKILYWNKKAASISGYASTDVIGQNCYNNILNHIDEAGHHLCENGCPLHKTLCDGISRETKLYLHHKEGHRVAVAVRTIPIYEEDEIIGAVELFVDDREKMEMISNLKELEKLSILDQLTGLPNRRYGEAYIKSRMSDFNNFKIPVGIAFIDIDYFKTINDVYGHVTGDKVLKMVSKTFKSAVRSNDIVIRWGGEEFIAVFTGVDEASIKVATEKLRMLVEESIIKIQGKELPVTISVGATIYKSGENMETFMHRSDENMYVAKNSGRNKVIVK